MYIPGLFFFQTPFFIKKKRKKKKKRKRRKREKEKKSNRGTEEKRFVLRMASSARHKTILLQNEVPKKTNGTFGTTAIVDCV